MPAISGVTIPKTLLQELLSYYSRTPTNPSGINMDAPFQFPRRFAKSALAPEPRSSCSDGFAAGPAAVPQGRGPAPRRRPETRRHRHRRRSAVPLPDALRRPRSFPDDCLASAWTAGGSAGEVLSCGIRPTRRPRFKIFEMLVRDQRQPARHLVQSAFSERRVPSASAGHPLRQAGTRRTACRCRVRSTRLSAAPTIRKTTAERAGAERRSTVHTGRIVPIYEKTGQLTAKMQRSLVHQVLESLPAALADPIPPDVRARQGLIDRRAAIAQVHFPSADTTVEESERVPARRRIAG